MFNWWWRRKARQEARKAVAEAELRTSRELLAETRKHTAPIRAAAEHNQFADMVRRALANGYGHEGGTRLCH